MLLKGTVMLSFAGPPQILPSLGSKTGSSVHKLSSEQIMGQGDRVSMYVVYLRIHVLKLGSVGTNMIYRKKS